MSKKNKCIIVLDTETAPIVKQHGDFVDARAMRVYDLGYIVRDKWSGEVYAERSFVCADTFFNGRDFMTSSYYAEKLPQYFAGIATGGEWKPTSFANAHRCFVSDFCDFGVSEVWAYNARFDRDALNATTKDVTAGVSEEFAEVLGGLKWRDIWPLAQVITGTNRYCEWATANGFVGATGIPKTSVEVLIKYLDQDEEFAERHTALDDARHESRILSLCLARHAKQPTTLGNGYRAAMEWAKQTGHYISKEER